MPREPEPTWSFVLAVVRLGARYLLVQEAKEGNPWYLPAGGVEPGEALTRAMHRETLEEGGIPIVLEGILRIERVVRHQGGVRLRVIFAARPADDTPPKQVADAESLGAGWFTLEEAAHLHLRGDDVLEHLRLGHDGAPVYPLALLHEHAR